MRSEVLAILFTLTFSTTLLAQSPIPVIVQAATPAIKSSQASAPSQTSGSLEGALKMLEEMKAANEETLRKQAATLQQLDELEKTAEQIKVYTRRS
jgi:hypothetical protein